MLRIGGSAQPFLCLESILHLYGLNVRFLTSCQIICLGAGTGGVWKGTIDGDGTVTFVDGGGSGIGATSIVQFYNSTACCDRPKYQEVHRDRKR